MLSDKRRTWAYTCIDKRDINTDGIIVDSKSGTTGAGRGLFAEFALCGLQRGVCAL
jgi:N-acetyl-gamma-glutamylphosphate reductase